MYLYVFEYYVYVLIYKPDKSMRQLSGAADAVTIYGIGLWVRVSGGRLLSPINTFPQKWVAKFTQIVVRLSEFEFSSGSDPAKPHDLEQVA